jgi:hypothetical protein
MGRRLVSVCAIGVLVSSAPSMLQAAELTDVVDALDVENDNPYDFHIEPSFGQRFESGIITRETPCGPDTTPACELPQTGLARELDYRRVINTLDFDVQVGLFRDLEFHVNLPVVISDQRRLRYADGVNRTNSSIFPSDDRVSSGLAQTQGSTPVLFDEYRFFDIPNDGPKRSGLGDMTFGLAWSPFNDARNAFVGNLTVGFDYLAPTGRPARGGNKGVGRGVHEVQFAIATSREFTEAHLDPYFGFRAALPLAAGNGLFESDPNSSLTAPGARFNFTAGTEIIMYENASRGQDFTFDVGMDFGYQLEGRDYSPLFDGFANSSCNGLTPEQAGLSEVPDGNLYDPSTLPTAANGACAWVVQQPGNADLPTGSAAGPSLNTPYSHDGILDVEGFGTVGGHTAFNLQFNDYIQVRLGFGFQYQTPHFLTTADAGRDADNNDIVDLNPEPTVGNEGIVERNPNYNLVLDAVGRRFRLENMLSLNWNIGVAFQF